MRTKPLRTAAAIAGMVAAVVAVVLVNAASVLSQDANSAYLARRYGLPITLRVQARGEVPAREHGERLQAILRGNGVRALSPQVSVGIQLLRSQSMRYDALVWVSSAYPSIRIVDMVAGSWPVETARSTVPQVVISEQYAESLGLTPRQAVGQVLSFAVATGTSVPDPRTTPVRPMVIDGVASSSSNAFEDASILLVSDLPQPDLTPIGGCISWLVRVNPVDYALVTEMVRSVVWPDGQPMYETRQVDQANQLAPVLEQQEVTARAVSLVALTVGGLGILGVGLAGVRERGREFGLRRALGASTVRIFVGVVLQTLLEAVFAAVIAILLAALLLEFYARELVLETLPLPPTTALPVSSAVAGLVGALVVGLLAGLLPAISAARSSVVQALRG